MSEGPRADSVGQMPSSRFGGRLRSYVAVAAAVVLLGLPARADRVLDFNVTTGQIAGVATAAVNADGMVVVRLRSTDGDGLGRKAEVVASRLADLALAGLSPEQIVVERVGGEWAVTGAGKLIIVGDTDTAAASGLDPRGLCESWRKRLAQVLAEPYLCVKPNDLLVVPFNEQRPVRFGGTTSANPSVESMAPGIARVEQQTGRALIHGVSPGTTVVIVEAGEARTAITVEVKKWAAQIAERALLRVLPGGLPEAMADRAILNAALSSVQPEPRATARMFDLQRNETGYSAALRAGGVEYLPVSRTVNIGVAHGQPPIPLPKKLLISNYPERVTGTGALMRQRLSADVPSRLMWHHKNYAGRPIVVTIRLVNAGTSQARIRVGWAHAGPDADEIFVGYNAMLRYWQSVRHGAGFVASVPRGRAFETSSLQLGPHDVVSGLMDLVADSGENLYLEVLARDPEDAPAGFAEVPGSTDELVVTPYEFPAVIASEVDYEFGGRYGHLSIGREDLENDQGFALAGAYGVSHIITVNASNPTGQLANLELALRAGGGVARTVTMIDGQLNSSGILSAGHEQLLERRPLPPGVAMKIRVEIIPTAGSNLPFTLVVRARAR